MAIKKVYELSVDMKRTSVRVNVPVLVQGDSAEFRIRLADNGVALSTEELGGITSVTMQSGFDAQAIIETIGTLEGSTAVFRLQKGELFRSGTVQAMVQLADADDRISTLRFEYQVIPELSGNYIPGEQDITVFQRYMNDAQAKIDEMAATDVAQLTVKLADTSEELFYKVGKGEGGSVSWAMADQNFREQVLGNTPPAIVGTNSVGTPNVIDKAIVPKKTDFISLATNNVVNEEFKGVSLSGSTGNGTPSTTRSATDFIPAVNGVSIYATTDGKVRWADLLSFILAYDSNKKFLAPATAVHVTELKINDFCFKYTFVFNGFIRMSIKTDGGFGLKNLCVSPFASFEPFLYQFDSRFEKTNETESLIQPKKNLLDKDTSVVGHLEYNATINSSPTSTYRTIRHIKVKKGEIYTLSPQIRKLVELNKYKYPIYDGLYVDEFKTNYVYTNTNAEYVAISYLATVENSIQMEKGSVVTGYEPYKLNVPKLDSGSLVSSLFNKAVLNLGDSIAAGSGNNGKSYAHIIAEKNSMPLFSYATGGATIAIVPDRVRIMTQIDQAIADGIRADRILFDGVANDAIDDRTTAGVITEGYTAALDESTFCGGLEATCKKLKLNWPSAKIIYVRVHNMSSRGILQKTYGDLAMQICKKWSIPVVDMFNEGGLNTNITIMRTQFTDGGDGTHPNGPGYDFYVGPIEAKMKSV